MKLVLLIMFVIFAIYWGGRSGYSLARHKYQEAIFNIMLEIVNIASFAILLIAL